MTARDSATQAAIAAHRFGYGQAVLDGIPGDPAGWVLQQLRAPEPMPTEGLMGSAEAGALGRRFLAASNASSEARESARSALRQAALLGWERRWQQVVNTPTPVAERWGHFWANHFCVSGVRGIVAPLVLPFEREAIRPHISGRFVNLLRAAIRHPAMLLFLDNAQSIGPGSRAGNRRARGLNENLARELLESHTLGVDGGYSQADVTETARLLTGWTVTRPGDASMSSTPNADRFETQFNPNWHEPGTRRILGRSYPEGPDSLDVLLEDLARHPATARHVSRQLARHFVADDPSARLVDALAARWRDSDGDLLAIADTLFTHPDAWNPAPTKVKRPEEWVLSAHRVLRVPIGPAERLLGALNALGQPPGRAPSPQGWPDRAEDWLGPDALMKRVEWTVRFAERDLPRQARTGLVQSGLNPTDRARAAFGPSLGETTLREVERADSGAQAVALWLASPEFQRR